jgi:hypothetical protein
MQTLESFASTISGLKNNDLILVVPLLARAPGSESTDDSLAGPSVRSSRTRAGKQKAVATLPPLKKPKVMGKKVGGLKINDPALKPSSTSTPPKGSWSKFTVQRSNSYTRLDSLLDSQIIF